MAVVAIWDRFDSGDEYVPIIYIKGQEPFNSDGTPNYIAAPDYSFETKAECRAWVSNWMRVEGLVWSDEAEGFVLVKGN